MIAVEAGVFGDVATVAEVIGRFNRMTRGRIEGRRAQAGSWPLASPFGACAGKMPSKARFVAVRCTTRSSDNVRLHQ